MPQIGLDLSLHRALTKRWRRHIGRRLMLMRDQKTDGIAVTLLREHNDPERQFRMHQVAETLAREYRGRGLRASVSRFEIEHMGGQHMETVYCVEMTILRKGARFSDEGLRIVQVHL